MQSTVRTAVLRILYSYVRLQYRDSDSATQWARFGRSALQTLNCCSSGPAARRAATAAAESQNPCDCSGFWIEHSLQLGRAH
jgi:hypothetical protein